MHIEIIVATTGRAAILAEALNWLGRQTQLPDRVMVVGAENADLPQMASTPFPLELLIADKGSCSQRNAALDRVGSDTDIIAFFDDDFFAADDYLAQLDGLFSNHDDLVGATGELLADGAHSDPISSEDARALLLSTSSKGASSENSSHWLYGCNMAVRASAVRDLRFDENLPLYGWQEDVDFSSRLAKYGRLVRTGKLTGVHLGTRRGRTSGLRFGYSQVANVLYLRRKGTIRPVHGWSLMLRNILANLVGSMRPPGEVDRRGRLRGNLVALGDLLHGRMNPRRITVLQ